MDATDTTDDAAAQRDEAVRKTGIDPATGFAHDGEWPVNGRLRAEAMARAGVTTDPADLIPDDLIASTKVRLDAEDKAEAEAEKVKPSMAWSRADLVTHAEGIGLTVESDANKAAILDAITTAGTNAAPAV